MIGADANTRGDTRASTDVTHALNTLAEAVAVLRQQLEVAAKRAEQAETALAGGAEARLQEADRQPAEFWSRSRWQRVRAVWSLRRRAADA